MPYSIDELKSKPTYQNIVDADKNELKKYFEDEELKAQESGSTMLAVRTLRDSEGFILSYESPFEKDKTMPSTIQKVRLPMTYFNAVTTELESKLKKERTFSSFRPSLKWPPPPPPPDEPEATVDEAKEAAQKLLDEIKEKEEMRKKTEEIAEATNKRQEDVVEEVERTKPAGKQDEQDRYADQSGNDGRDPYDY